METEEEIIQKTLSLLKEKLGGVYSEKVIDLGTNPRNYGTMEDPDAYAKVTGPCGDTVEIFLRLRRGKIEDIRLYYRWVYDFSCGGFRCY